MHVLAILIFIYLIYDYISHKEQERQELRDWEKNHKY